MRTVLIGLLLLGSASAALKTGPNAGATIPRFSLKDQNGKAQTLRTLAGPSGTMLVFYRSADW